MDHQLTWKITSSGFKFKPHLCNIQIPVKIDRSDFTTSIEIPDFFFDSLGKDFISFKAINLLSPLSIVIGMDIDEMIFHFQVGNHFQLRTGSTVRNSTWLVDRAGVHPFMNHKTDENWTIEVTDHRYWSSSM